VIDNNRLRSVETIVSTILKSAFLSVLMLQGQKFTAPKCLPIYLIAKID